MVKNETKTCLTGVGNAAIASIVNFRKRIFIREENRA